MNKLGIGFSLLTFVFAVAIGVYGGARSWKGVVYLTDGTLVNSSRNPAAIKRELDFSRLDGAELIMATQKRLVSAAKIIIHEGQLGVELGHFVTRDLSGQRRLACDSNYNGTYNRLTLRFDAEGVASAGETPYMEVDAPCRSSLNDITRVDPIWIPVRKILESKAIDSDVDFADGVKYKFSFLNGNWPGMWTLQSVRLYSSEDASREVRISARELKEIRKRPVILNWHEAR